MARCFVTRRLPGDALERLAAAHEVDVWPERTPPAPEELRDRVAGAEGLLCLLTDRIDAPLLDAAPSLRVISNYAVGADNIDVAAAKARGIAVGYTPDVLTDATADLAFALLLAIARRLPEGMAAVRDGEWKTWEPDWLLGPRRPRRDPGDRRPRADRAGGGETRRGLRDGGPAGRARRRARARARARGLRLAACARSPTRRGASSTRASSER